MTSEASSSRLRPATSRQTGSSAGPSSPGTRSPSRIPRLKKFNTADRNDNISRASIPQSSSAPIRTSNVSVPQLLGEIPILNNKELSIVKNAGEVNFTNNRININLDRNLSQTDGSQSDRINHSNQPVDIAASQKAEYEIYYHQLLVKRRGSPLWQPGPNMRLPVEYRRNGVMFGDVGILYRTGNFDFLFNILLPANHEINKNRVPEGFYHLDRSDVERNNISENVVYGRNSFVASSSLQRTRKANPSGGFIYKTTDKEGAILVMPDGASSEDLLNDKVLEDYVKANARSWYEYVTCASACGRRIENGDLHIVVGFDKVSSWGIATFANNVQEQVQFEFRSVDDGADARTYEWESVNGRVGPPEEEMHGLTQESDTSPLRNQCVFLRTLNFNISGEIEDKLAVHAVRSNQIKDDSVPPRSHDLPKITVINPHLPLSVQHPSKLLNMKLLEKFPNAEVAITRDADWISVITEDDVAFPDPEDLVSRIMGSHAICEKDGIVTLRTSKRKEKTTTEDLNDVDSSIVSNILSGPAIPTSKTLLYEMPSPRRSSANPLRHNIIIFGESGAGKSSLVNMLVGSQVAKVASTPFGCTFKADSYDTTIHYTSYRIYDTAGLNETEQGRLPHWQAIANLYTLIRELDSVSLLIYCIRGRIKENTRANWELFNNIICGGRVPIIAVVTGVENDDDWDKPEKVDEMKKALKRLKIEPNAISFVVPILGKRNEHADFYGQSQTNLRRIIEKTRRKEPWSSGEKEEWFASIYQKVYRNAFCIFPQTKLEFAGALRNLVDQFVKEAEVTEQDANALRATLLHAEKVFSKPRRSSAWG